MLMTTKEAARALGVSPAQVRSLVRSGGLPAAKIAGRWRLRLRPQRRSLKRPVRRW